jgi:hypothetical protein
MVLTCVRKMVTPDDGIVVRHKADENLAAKSLGDLYH